MKSRKGFTLIEIMIAVAIIGILALVLIPKISGMKTQTKLSGVDTNMRVAEGIVSNVINDFDSTDDLTDLETAIRNRLGDVKNPLNQGAGVELMATVTAGTDDAAFVYTDGDENDLAAVNATLDPLRTTPDTDLEGTIAISAYVNGATVSVLLTPFDDQGREMSKKAKTITK